MIYAPAAPMIWVPSARRTQPPGPRLPREARQAAVELFEDTRAVMRRIAKALGALADFQWSNSGGACR